MSHDTAQRSAQQGELCTCGRQAVTVFLTERFGEVGYCGVPNVPKVEPCPFCGEGPHEQERCPLYVLRPEPLDDEVDAQPHMCSYCLGRAEP